MSTEEEGLRRLLESLNREPTEGCERLNNRTWKTYDQVLEKPRMQTWYDENYVVHRVAKCNCDKCGHIRTLRAERRSQYLKDNRLKYNHRLVEYMKTMRGVAVSKGRPRHMNLVWSGCPWLDADYELWKAVKEYCKVNSISASALIRSLLEKQVKTKRTKKS